MADVHVLTSGTTASYLLQDVYLAGRFVSSLRQNLVFLQLAMPEDAPQSSGIAVRWNYFTLPSAVSAITEGSTPTSDTMTINSAQATLNEYGAVYELTKLFQLTATSGSVEKYVEAAAYQASLTIDTVLYDSAIQQTTTTQNAGTSMSAGDVKTGVQTLKANDAQPHRATPGGQFYCGVFSIEAAYDMMGEGSPTWFQVKSGDYERSLLTPFEATPPTAAIYGAIIKTSNGIQDVSTEDDNALIADDSFGALSLDSPLANPRVIITTPEQAVHKPLRNVGSIGWDLFFSTAIFDSNRILLLKSDITQ